VLSDVFENQRYRSRVEKMKQDAKTLKIDCYVTPTIFTECTGRVGTLYRFLKSTILELYSFVLREKGTDVYSSAGVKLEEKDQVLIERFFLFTVKDEKGPFNTEKEQLEQIETWIIKFLEEQRAKKKEVLVDQFFVQCIVQLNRLSTNMQNRLILFSRNLLKVMDDPVFVAKLKGCLPSPTPNDKDLAIITEVANYMTTGRKAVLVALDYRELVRNADPIEREVGVRVCDPLYARYWVEQI
jgi:hypothetical protein